MSHGNIDDRLALAAFVDVETTGLSPDRDEVVELAISLFEYRKDTYEIIQIVDHYTGLREPSVPMTLGAAQVHGLTEAELEGQELDYDRVNSILEQAEVILAHNARFDSAFVTKLFPLAKTKPWYCSMDGIDWRGKGFASKGLQRLLQAHGIKPESAHRASADVDSAIKLLSLRNDDDEPYLKELLGAKEAEPTHTAAKEEGCGSCTGCLVIILLLIILLRGCR